MDNKLEKIVSLCKRRGFVFQGSEIYGGLAGTWDYGPYGAELSNNVKNLWWKMFVTDREDMFGMDAAIIMHPKAWEASGHVHGYGFADPLVECQKCHHRFRADQLDDKTKCPDCGGILGEQTHFNLMFKTQVGTGEEISYLRPETAGGMFVNFKNILDSMHPKLPFGLAQIGKSFRNEIAPRDFVFRSREFRQMEVEYFIYPDKWEQSFEEWRKTIQTWCEAIGLDKSHVHELEVPDADRAHYSKRTIDFEFDYPFGRKELYGLAYRTDFDLKAHSVGSGVDLSYFDEETKERFTPHVIEPSLGLDRTILAILTDAYTEDEMNGEKREFLKLKPALTPVKIAVFPLLKNKPELVEKAKEIYKILKAEFICEFDDNGNIGKRYRRQDEIGTPFCVTIDFETIEKSNGVTVRDRDTGKQDRISESDLIFHLRQKLSQ